MGEIPATQTSGAESSTNTHTVAATRYDPSSDNHGEVLHEESASSHIAAANRASEIQQNPSEHLDVDLAPHEVKVNTRNSE